MSLLPDDHLPIHPFIFADVTIITSSSGYVAAAIDGHDIDDWDILDLPTWSVAQAGRSSNS